MDPQINLDGLKLHKQCAKCKDCNCQITLSNFAKHETDDDLTLLCKTHYFKRFHEQGAYLGSEKFQKKQEREINLLANNGASASQTPLQNYKQYNTISSSKPVSIVNPVTVFKSEPPRPQSVETVAESEPDSPNFTQQSESREEFETEEVAKSIEINDKDSNDLSTTDPIAYESNISSIVDSITISEN